MCWNVFSNHKPKPSPIHGEPLPTPHANCVRSKQTLVICWPTNSRMRVNTNVKGLSGCSRISSQERVQLTKMRRGEPNRSVPSVEVISNSHQNNAHVTC